MEAASFSRNLDSLSFVSGVSFSLEQRASLPISLSILKSQQNLSKVVLWGRILGEKSDYLIAQGWNPADLSKSDLSNRGQSSIVLASFFESLAHIEKKSYRLGSDGVTWVPLPNIDAALSKKYLLWKENTRSKGTIFSPFTGDAATKFAFEVVGPAPPTPPPAEDGSDVPVPEAPRDAYELSEEERLACVVSEIDEDTSVVPKGAYVLTGSQQVVSNPFFKASHDISLTSFCHLRKPKKLQGQTAADRSALSKSVDFLDTLEGDRPIGCWSVQQDDVSGTVAVRSLWWPGYFFYQVSDTDNFGAFYNGYGDRNDDIAFTL